MTSERANVVAMWSLPMARPEIAPGEVHLWRARCVPAKLDIVQVGDCLMPEEMERAGRLATALLRRRFLQAHTLLHRLLRLYTQAGSRRCELAYHVSGKPYLRFPQLQPSLEFNMSHAGEAVVIALGRGQAVGVDIEVIRPLDDLDAMIEATCSSREARYLMTLAPDARLQKFYYLWTRKEAWLKLTGDGLRSLSSMAVDVPIGVRLFDISFVNWATAGEKIVGSLALTEGHDPPIIKQFEASW